MSEPQVEIVEAGINDKPVVRQLLELYQYDFSEFVPGDVDEHGLYGYQYLDNYWTEADRTPLLIRADGHVAGFALINTFAHSGLPADFSIAEFFVARKHRRSGGIAASRRTPPCRTVHLCVRARSRPTCR